jgi:hypothetical protein
MSQRILPVLLVAVTIFLSVYLGVTGTASGYCTTVANCYNCSADPSICVQCNEMQFFCDNDVHPPVCRNCTELPGCLACFSKQRCAICINPGSNGPDLHSPIGTCSPCAPYCIQCNISGSGKCDGCIGGYFVDSNQQCSECANNCISCVNATFCNTCQSGNYRLASGACTPCTVNGCAKCRSDGSCTTCVPPHIPSSDGSACISASAGSS